MREKHKTAYFCLLYVMTVQTHSLDTETTNWAGCIDADVTNKAIEHFLNQNPGYLHTEKRKATLIHDILTLVLLKSAADNYVVFQTVLRHYRTDILLELLRPGEETQCEFCTGLAKSRKNEGFREVEKDLIYNTAKLCGENLERMSHPLKFEELLKEKYERFLKDVRRLRKT